jgi:hypothetical protein
VVSYRTLTPRSSLCGIGRDCSIAILVSVLIVILSGSLFLTRFVLGRQCETNSASAQPQMEVFFARPMGKTGDSTFEEVADNSNALKYRDAFYQKDEHRWTKRRVPGR